MLVNLMKNQNFHENNIFVYFPNSFDNDITMIYNKILIQFDQTKLYLQKVNVEAIKRILRILKGQAKVVSQNSDLYLWPQKDTLKTTKANTIHSRS